LRKQMNEHVEMLAACCLKKYYDVVAEE